MRKSLLLILFFASFNGTAAMRQTVDGIEMFADPRTPSQLAGFYSARGLPPAAIETMQQYCFVTVGLHNHRRDVAWLMPERWEFTDAVGRKLTRVARTVWDARWEALKLPGGARSAFGWTQLPDTRDLQPDEPVGGNLALAQPQGAVNIVAIFPIGARDSAHVVRIRFSNLRCGKGSE